MKSKLPINGVQRTEVIQMNIKLVVVGKIKEAYLNEGINEYLKRLKPYVNLEIVEVKDEPIADKPNASEIKKAIDFEGEKVLKKIKQNEYVIGLDLDKKQFKSPAFAEFLMKKMENNNSSLTFVIGGSYGLSIALKDRLNDSFSLGEMTLTHQMTRLILLEQIYRAFKILNNEVYHK